MQTKTSVVLFPFLLQWQVFGVGLSPQNDSQPAAASLVQRTHLLETPLKLHVEVGFLRLKMPDVIRMFHGCWWNGKKLRSWTTQARAVIETHTDAHSLAWLFSCFDLLLCDALFTFKTSWKINTSTSLTERRLPIVQGTGDGLCTFISFSFFPFFFFTRWE